MHRSLKLLLTFLFGLFLFAAGYVYQGIKLWSQHPVEITIHNKSGKSLNKLSLSYDSGIKGTIEVPPPQNGKSVTVRYYPWGEGSFSIVATLATGKTIKHVEGYVEAGYVLDKFLINDEFKGNL